MNRLVVCCLLLLCALGCKPENSAARLATAPGPDLARRLAEGERLYQQMQCVTCHSSDGETWPTGGPSFQGLWGGQSVLVDGSSVERTEAYLRESVRDPCLLYTSPSPRDS